MPVHELDHPLFSDRLAVLRDRKTSARAFRAAVEEISGFLAYELARILPTRKVLVDSPLARAECTVIDREHVVLAPILRAGIGLVPGVQRVFPGAPVLHLGIYRDEASLEPVFYYRRISTDLASRTIVLLDPMLATGGTLCAAAELLQAGEPKRMAALCLLASRQGVEALSARFPELDIFTGAVDPDLDERGFIIPGLGDAGDRMFATDKL